MSIVEAEFIDLRDVRPFVKWAGGKGQLLPELDRMIPRQFISYHEPFLGGGAMFFQLISRGIRFGSAYPSDTNTELITAYRAVKDGVVKQPFSKKRGSQMGDGKSKSKTLSVHPVKGKARPIKNSFRPSSD